MSRDMLNQHGSHDDTKWGYPTIRNGVRFRSILEADWAAFFDQHGMEWLYEPDTIRLGDVAYVPDFWFPKLQTVVEVKGVIDDSDRHKLTSFSRHAGVLGVSTLVAGSFVGRDVFAVATSPSYLWRPPRYILPDKQIDTWELICSTPYQHMECEQDGSPIYTGLVSGVWFAHCTICDTWCFASPELCINDGCPVCHSIEYQLHGMRGPCNKCGMISLTHMALLPDDRLYRYWHHLNVGNAVPLDNLDYWRCVIPENLIMSAMETACRRMVTPISRARYVIGILRSIENNDQTYLPCEFDFGWPNLDI